ncbi:MAG: outer membrane lipoprotein carrier protein LolA [Porticoccaceae bacterium]|nr:outer membrane lipoprotein carrier protein LolA [Porticoccaceae bacterium]
MKNRCLTVVALWVVTLLLAGGTAWAQDHQQADDSLVSLAARLAQIDILDGEFEQIRHISVLAVPLHSSGTFRYRRSEGIVWRTTDPIANEVRITPTDGVVAGDATGTLRPVPSSELVAGIFLGVFSGDLDRLAEYFDVAHASRGDSWTLRLTPRLPALAQQMEGILLEGSDHIERVEIRDTNGDRSELLLRVTTTRHADQ